MDRKVVFFQPSTNAKANYSNQDGNEQIWIPWFAPILAPAAKRYGWNVKLVDARLLGEKWCEEVASLKPGDLLAITVMTGHAIIDAIEASIIAQNKGAYVVWGGPHVTLFPTETLNEAPLDFCVVGYGYTPFYKLIANLTRYDDVIPPIIGLLARKMSDRLENTQYISNSLPAYYLDIISKWEPYVNSDIAISNRTINFISSEGCPRYCTFCSEPITSNRHWNVRGIDQVVSDCISAIRRSNASGLKLHDPNFFHSRERAKRFAYKLSASLDIKWAAAAHPEDIINMTETELNALSECGLSRLLIGLESPIRDIIKMSGKAYDPEHIPSLARKLKNAGIRGMFTYIVGWPNAKISHYDETLKSAFGIKDIWHEHQCKIHFLEPWPGSPIFSFQTRKSHLKIPSSLHEWAKIDYYQAHYQSMHNQRYETKIREANEALSPYVKA